MKKFTGSDETTGYGHETLIETLVPPIQRGNLKDIYLIGGCDNSDPERDIYSTILRGLPKSAAIITLGCGKFKLFG